MDSDEQRATESKSARVFELGRFVFVSDPTALVGPLTRDEDGRWCMIKFKRGQRTVAPPSGRTFALVDFMDSSSSIDGFNFVVVGDGVEFFQVHRAFIQLT